MGFEALLGNETLRGRLTAAAAQGRLSHCYTLCGPEGSGRRTLARLLAAAMQCTGDPVPCGVCPGCRKALSGLHPDVITCVDEKHKLFGVDAARSVSADAIRFSSSARRSFILSPPDLIMRLKIDNRLKTTDSRQQSKGENQGAAARQLPNNKNLFLRSVVDVEHAHFVAAFFFFAREPGVPFFEELRRDLREERV